MTPGPASAQENGTITISGVLNMDYDSGIYYVSPELFRVFANGYEHGYEHTWTLTLRSITQSHTTNGSDYATEFQTTSFNLEFFGPDAVTLNAFVSERIAGGGVYVKLQNTYYESGGGLAIMQVWAGSYPGTYFYSGNDVGVDTLLPADADGYPVVGPEPFSIEANATELGYFELFSGWVAAIGSPAGLDTFEWMPDAPPLTITSSNNVVMVSWPSPSTGFTLQQINQLNSTNWVTSMETVTDTGTIKFITVDPSVGSRFYRLFKP